VRGFFALMVDLERAKDILSGNSRDYGTLRLLPYDDLSTLYSIIAEIFHQNRISEGSLYDTFRPYLDTLVLISFFFFTPVSFTLTIPKFLLFQRQFVVVSTMLLTTRGQPVSTFDNSSDDLHGTL